MADHLGDDRWREVFLLSASLLSEESANDFFFTMQQGADELLAADPALVQLLTWADDQCRKVNSPTKQFPVVRLAYIFLAFAREIDRYRSPARTLALTRDLARDLTRDLTRDLARARAITRDITRAISRDRVRNFAHEMALARSRGLDLGRETAPHIGFDYSLFYTWAYAQLFANRKVDEHDQVWQEAMVAYSHLSKSMIVLAKETGLPIVAQTVATQPLPPSTAAPQAWQQYANTLYAILQQRDLARQWAFSDEQSETLERYFAANELLIQCLKVATVTDRQAIWNGLLEPPVPRTEEKPTTVASAKKTGKSWWKLW